MPLTRGSYTIDTPTRSTMMNCPKSPKIAVFGDFSQFYIVDRVGVSLMYEPMVKGTANARPTGQAGWFMFWRTGSDVATPSGFRVLVTA